MLFSIIIPCYNQGVFLHRALESLLSQTFTNWECLIINDGSTDNTPLIAKQYTSKDSRLKYYYKNNGGLSDARNYGIERSKGKFIFFLDSDDRLSNPEALNAFAKAISHRQTTDVVCANTNYEYANENVEESNQIKNVQELSFKDNAVINVFFKHTSAIACNKLYRTAFLKEHNHSFIKGLKHEDEIWSLKIFLTAKEVVCIPDFTYNYYRDNPNSITTNINNQNIEARIFLIEQLISIYKNPSLEYQRIRFIEATEIVNRIRLYYGFLKTEYLLTQPKLWMKYYTQVQSLWNNSPFYLVEEYLIYQSWIAYISTYLVYKKNFKIPFLHRISAHYYKL